MFDKNKFILIYKYLGLYKFFLGIKRGYKCKKWKKFCCFILLEIILSIFKNLFIVKYIMFCECLKNVKNVKRMFDYLKFFFLVRIIVF